MSITKEDLMADLDRRLVNRRDRSEVSDMMAQYADMFKFLTNVKDSKGEPLFNATDINGIFLNRTCRETIKENPERILAILSNPEEIKTIALYKNKDSGLYQAIEEPLDSTLRKAPKAFGKKSVFNMFISNNRAYQALKKSLPERSTQEGVCVSFDDVLCWGKWGVLYTYNPEDAKDHECYLVELQKGDEFIGPKGEKFKAQKDTCLCVTSKGKQWGLGTAYQDFQTDLVIPYASWIVKWKEQAANLSEEERRLIYAHIDRRGVYEAKAMDHSKSRFSPEHRERLYKSFIKSGIVGQILQAQKDYEQMSPEAKEKLDHQKIEEIKARLVQKTVAAQAFHRYYPEYRFPRSSIEKVDTKLTVRLRDADQGQKGKPRKEKKATNTPAKKFSPLKRSRTGRGSKSVRGGTVR